jgi:hypothetical protein
MLRSVIHPDVLIFVISSTQQSLANLIGPWTTMAEQHSRPIAVRAIFVCVSEMPSRRFAHPNSVSSIGISSFATETKKIGSGNLVLVAHSNSTIT